MGYWAVLRYRNTLKLVGAATVPYDTLFGEVPTEAVAPVPPSKPERKSSAKPPDEILCIRCGYNLRGLASDGQCPECGTPIERSRRGNILAAADSAWLAGLCRGLTLVIAAVAVHSAGLLLGFLDIAPLVDREVAIEAVRRGVSAVLLLAGVVLLTSLDPRLTLAEHPVVLRKVARGIATAALLLYILTLSLAPTAPGVLLAGGFKWSLTALFIAAIVSASLYLARLAERIPDEELASSTRSTARKFAVTMPVVLVSIAVGDGLTLPSTQPSVPHLVVLGFFILLLLCFAPYNLYYMFTLFSLWTDSYRKAFRKCLAEAQDRDRAITERSVGLGSAQPPASESRA